jgi:hypothetical protein
MITIEKQDKATILRIGTHQVQADEHGTFFVSRPTLLPEDLSLLPSGTFMAIDDPDGQSHEQIIGIEVLKVLDEKSVLVTGNHWRCGQCWNHAMDYYKYNLAVVRILETHSSPHLRFKYEGCKTTPSGEPVQMFTLELANGTYADIEQKVKEAVMPVLQPLLDFRDSMDNKLRKQFGV